MSTKATKGPARKPKPVVVKTTLNNPYDIDWNTVVGDDMQFILQTLMEKFNHVGLKKIEMKTEGKKAKKETPSTNGKKKKEKGKKTKDSDVEIKSCEEADKEELQKESENKPGWTHVDLRKQLAIGINEVTRALEKNEVYLVLVCKSAKPTLITKHLVELSASREVPACQLPRLSENIAPVLGLKSVLALGFKKSSDVFLEEVKAVISRVPPLKVPWLQSESQKAESSEDELVIDEESSSEPKKRRKRKIGESEEKTSKTKLQGLKVKKIVPNPNKVRKVKNKKNVGTKK
ncbi:ribonuclease P protein subunit p38 [Bombina bombina]|uniref:ribonuclease P protein subunit p38 n=1 Tax=Bombina bombina TaxID=8345 RepID=UPI00235A6154|nr:ribonuclease P protein subunit p38 [Bombina bombina]XP_053569981.1 ribonuclease P protein subunit p38 [Bombina bombina]XP_053569982.1 ribonuclease P protein subunit p38 [Bombina bombina]XP_053569983.1 ribonuclease P protein subunit p38 [Bombina bombina]